jgi:hypothetical protein
MLQKKVHDDKIKMKSIMKDQRFDPAHTEAFILEKFDNVKTDIDQFFLLKKFDSENEKFPEKIYKRNETLKIKKKDQILDEDEEPA